ncbi:hypothetical protein HYN59_11775 [Flavobacterium album]|uniref:Uncharacterized protein n=1 Tax=Flavobacterium album TaxID=2175091 RepID=A0A2S1QZD7_9FLAO|nr:hypothetical protein [Flavobacterium album]AWH85745.1 hypothetical protein HYN59_11775 [Flavobacterium album]
MNNFRLDKEPKITSGYKAPDGYFDSFTERLMQQLPQQEAKVIPLYKRKPVWLSVAASFIIMLTLGVFLTTNTSTPQPDDEAIESYLAYQTNINSYDLMQHLDTQDIAELEQSIPVSDEAIEEYLSDESIDLNE